MDYAFLQEHLTIILCSLGSLILAWLKQRYNVASNLAAGIAMLAVQKQITRLQREQVLKAARGDVLINALPSPESKLDMAVSIYEKHLKEYAPAPIRLAVRAVQLAGKVVGVDLLKRFARKQIGKAFRSIGGLIPGKVVG